MYKIKCQNIKCDGCVKKINDALLEKYPTLRVDKAQQCVEVETQESEVESIKTKLRELGFLAPDGIFNKVKGFFRK